METGWEIVGAVRPGEKKTLRRPCCDLEIVKGDLQKKEKTFTRAYSDNGFKLRVDLH